MNVTAKVLLRFIILGAVLILAAPVFPQSDTTITTTTKTNTKIDKPFRMKKSPLIASLLSAVIPGAGQIYNQSYWKAPIIMGLVGYFGYEYFNQNSKYIDYRDQYLASQTPENPDGDPNLKSLREFYRDQRNDFVWYFAIVYTINIIDAYVDAHLFDFDVSEDKLLGGGFSKTARVKLNLRF